jgi:hypothetical protein
MELTQHTVYHITIWKAIMKKQKLDCMVSVYFTTEEKSKLQKISELEERSISKLIGRATRQFIEQYEVCRDESVKSHSVSGVKFKV